MATSNKGAPATAKRLEEHEADAEATIVRLKEEIEKQQVEHDKLDGAEDRQGPIRAKLGALRVELNDAYDLWFKLSKQVREYDKAIDATRREGEKILRADVEKLLEQTWRFQRIGRENFIIAIAQDAIHCRDEQDFYQKFAEQIRECETNNLKLAIEHEKAPEFVIGCYERSL